MTPTKGIILLAATNRPEVLDQALLRPGRFDRRITIDRPNLAGRIATLQVHTRNIKLAEDVNLKKGGPGHCGLRGRGPCQSGERSGPAGRAEGPQAGDPGGSSGRLRAGHCRHGEEGQRPHRV